MGEGVKKIIIVKKSVLLGFFPIKSLCPLSWLRRGWKSYEPIWFIQRPYSWGGGGGVNSISVAQDMSHDGLFQLDFLQLLKDGPF